MSIENIIFGVFESDTVKVNNLNEGFLPLNPTLAFLTLKRNSLGKLRTAGKDVDDALDNDVKRIKSKGALAKEKIRAGAGKTSGKGDGATVYKLTPKQLEILSEIHEKYGDDLVDDVMLFRKNILAPYQLIKRMVKNNKTITAKDKFGMTHAQFTAGVESGKKKIEKRGGYFDKEDTDQSRINELDKSIEALRELEGDFKNDKIIKEYIVNKVLKFYHLDHSEFEGTSFEDLKRTFSELRKNNRVIQSYLDPKSKVEIKDTSSALAAQDIVKRNIALRKGIVSKERQRKEKAKAINDIEESINEELNTEGDKKKFDFLMKGTKFNSALGKYMLRRDIVKEIHSDSNNRAKKMYVFIVREMIKDAIERRKKMATTKAGSRTKIEFTDVERRIYKERKSVGKEYSGNLNDYVQIIKDEDFGNPKYIKRPPKLVAAEQKIEAEIKRFERALKKELDPEDYKKLKQFRLINNLITVKELQSPDKLFKSPSEISGNSADDEDKTEES